MKPFATIFTVVAFVASLSIFQTFAAEDRFDIRGKIRLGVTARAEASFQWENVQPSTELAYQPCFNNTFQCAKLEVPMDYNNTGRTKVNIAIVRLPAPVPVSDPRYAGVVFTNPGGPGGSGVISAQSNGKQLQTIVNPEPNSNDPDAKYYDIVGWDPRGVGVTTPAISCFPNSFSRRNWYGEGETIGNVGSSEVAMIEHWYRSKAQGEGCSEYHGAGEDGISEHTNTTPGMLDIIQMIEAHARWVDKEVEKTDPGRKSERKSADLSMFQFWGFSYGSIIGQTFAAMYPDRVGRIVVDGIVDPTAYYTPPFFGNLADTDKILVNLFEHCAKAGPERCPLYQEGGASAIAATHDEFMTKIRKSPIPVPASPTRGPEIVTWSDMVSFVRLSMYQPLMFSAMVTQMLADLYKGNGTSYADYRSSSVTQTCPTEDCLAAGPYSPACNPDNGRDASSAIMCSEAPLLGSISFDEFRDYADALHNQSNVLGYWWSHERLGCVGWKAKAKWHFEGPYGGDTAHPLLFIGNTLDPVTPLQNAVNGAKRYRDAVVLQLDAEGHTSLRVPSICIAQGIRKYFQTGDVPPAGTVCKPAEVPFLGAIGDEQKRSLEDERLLSALQGIAKTIQPRLRG